MERLTDYENITWHCHNIPLVDMQLVFDRLAAYEDTGLTPEQVKAQKWISVKDGLPEKTGSYLVFYHEWSGGAFLPTYEDFKIRVMRFLNSRKWCYPVCVDKRCEADTNREVTHWMPLPEPPKEAHDE